MQTTKRQSHGRLQGEHTLKKVTGNEARHVLKLKTENYDMPGSIRSASRWFWLSQKMASSSVLPDFSSSFFVMSSLGAVILVCLIAALRPSFPLSPQFQPSENQPAIVHMNLFSCLSQKLAFHGQVPKWLYLAQRISDILWSTTPTTANSHLSFSLLYFSAHPIRSVDSAWPLSFHHASWTRRILHQHGLQWRKNLANSTRTWYCRGGVSYTGKKRTVDVCVTRAA